MQLVSAKTILLTALALGNASALAEGLVPLASLRQSPDTYHYQVVLVRGFVARDPLGYAYLFQSATEAKAKDFPNALNVLPAEDGVPLVPLPHHLSCVELRGKFYSWFKSHSNLTDYYVESQPYILSNSGGLRVNQASACKAVAP